MDLTGRLLTFGFRRPRVLLMPAPGSGATRLRAQAWLSAQGWRTALSPADADLALVVGQPGAELAERQDRAWEQLPGPRARVVLPVGGDPAAVLLGARGHLHDLDAQREDARRRTAQTLGEDMDMGGDGDGDGDGEDMDMGMRADDMDGDGGMDMGGMDMGGMDMGGMDMGGMDMGGMDMPGGLGMADQADDRDGLRLEALHLDLGPVLPWWPAGLLAEVTVQGDVVQTASVRVLDAAPGGHEDDVVPPALAALDRAHAVLRLAGSRWAAPAQALLGQALLGQALPGHAALGDADPAEDGLARLRARVGRDRLLRWSLRGLPVVGAGADGPADLWAQLLGLLDAPAVAPAPLDPAGLEAALAGRELAAVRLLVAAAPPVAVAEPARG